MKILIPLLLLLMSTLFLTAQEDSSTPEQKGEKIGTIVKSALNVVVPAVSPLMDIIWPDRSKNKVTQEEMKEHLESARKEMIKSFQEKMKPSLGLHEEMSIFKQYLLPAENIKLKSYIIKEMLKNSSINWNSIDIEYKILKQYKSIITGLDTSKLRDKWVRSTFDKLGNKLNIDIITPLENYIPGKDKGNTLARIDELIDLTGDISLIISYQMDGLDSEFKALSDWANQSMGVAQENESLSTQQQKIKERIDLKYQE